MEKHKEERGQMKNNKILKYSAIFIGIFLLILGIGYGFANHYFSKLAIEREKLNNTIIIDPNQKETTTVIETESEPEPEKLGDVKIFIMGTDKGGYLTDSMLIVDADFDSDTVSMFSIPRDYRVTLTPKIQKLIGYYNENIKLTELHSYAKMANYKSPPSITASVTEELVGFKFDYIVLVNLQAFRDAVDAIGGVKVYVPRNFDYDDPKQDLYIHLKPGEQLLDGKTAEGLVRFRRSADGNDYSDFDRIEMQQYFLKEFVKKLISMEGVLNFQKIFSVVEKNVKTDATLNDALDLLSKANHLSMKRVYAHTLPGENEIIDDIFYLSPPPIKTLHRLVKTEIETDRAPTVNSKDYELIVLNGANKNKIAAKYAKILEDEGYTIKKIGNLTDANLEMTNKTRIFVPKEGLGKDLQTYFPLSEIIYDKDSENIKIVIGKLIKE